MKRMLLGLAFASQVYSMDVEIANELGKKLEKKKNDEQQ